MKIYIGIPAELLGKIDAEVWRRNAENEAQISRAGWLREAARAHLACRCAHCGMPAGAIHAAGCKAGTGEVPP